MLEQYMTRGPSYQTYTELNEQLLYTDFITSKYNLKEVMVDPIVSYRYQGNLYGLFKEMMIDPDLYLLAMYINGYNNPLNFEGKKVRFQIPHRPPIPE